MRVAVVSYDHVVHSSVTGPIDILEQSGKMYQELHQLEENYFSLALISFSEEENNWLNPLLNASLSQNDQFELVIIPAMHPEYIQEVLQMNTLIKWIKKQYRGGARIASICMGAFILGAAGLLEGKRVTTHWVAKDQLKKLFPAAIILDDKIIVDEGKICTCAGAFSFTTFILYLVEQYCGREVSLQASRLFLVDLHKHPQNSYAIFSYQKDHGNKTILAIQNLIEENYNKHLNIAELAVKACMSRRTFNRRFKNLTGNTPVEYIQRVRVEAGKRLLAKTDQSAEQIGLDCGYEDYQSFRKVFQRYTSCNPTDYRQRFKGYQN